MTTKQGINVPVLTFKDFSFLKEFYPIGAVLAISALWSIWRVQATQVFSNILKPVEIQNTETQKQLARCISRDPSCRSFFAGAALGCTLDLETDNIKSMNNSQIGDHFRGIIESLTSIPEEGAPTLPPGKILKTTRCNPRNSRCPSSWAYKPAPWSFSDHSHL